MRNRILKHFIVGFILALISGVGLLVVSTSSVFAQSGSLDVGLDAAAKTGLVATDIRLVIASVIRAALGFLGILALGIILYAGFRWMTAAGNDEQIADSKRILINGVIGLAIILSAFAITNFVIGQLNDAINNAGGGGSGGGGGGGGPLPGTVLYVSSLPPGGPACIRNVHPTIVFSMDVDVATVNGNIVINNDAGQAVAGAWGYVGNDKTTVAFTPSGSCAPDAGNDCLLPQTDYHLVFVNPGNVKSLNGNLTLNCLIKAGCSQVDFTTGTGVDRDPPTISFVSPNPGDSLQAGANIPVTLHFTDDSGVQQVRLASGGFTVGSQSFANCQKSGNVTLTWPTQNLTPGQFTLDATAIDFSAQLGTASTNLTLKPAACFNGVLDQGETQIDCGGVCGACGGSVCTQNSDCASGYCYKVNGQPTGICVNRMSIQAFSPNSGAPGTIVSVDGFFFGTTTGHVYFANKQNPDPAQPGDWVEAQLAPCSGPNKTWTNYEILVQVPNGAVNGPIMVVTAPVNVGGNMQTFTDTTNDTDIGPVLSDFQVTNQIRPGLCSATPNSGVAGDAVALGGQHFGLLDNGQDAVLFDDQKAQVSPQNWNDSFVSAQVPNTAPLGSIAVKVVNNGVESNGVRFTVNAGVNAANPIVTSVSPQNGGAGEYVTITGSHFGTKQGSVWFKLNGQGNATLGDINFPQACQNVIWSDTKVLIKVPQALKGSNGDYTVQVVTGDAVPLVSPVSDAAHFAVQNVEPTPGICLISPASGLVPFAPGQTLKVYGEYFGATPGVYFWKPGANGASIVGRTQADPQDNFSVNGTIITARPPADTQTGPVVVYRTEDQKLSNDLLFSTNDCTQNAPVANTCNQGGYTCCVSGAQRGMCVAPGQLCQGQTVSAAYVWRFSTREIPPVPHVVERCNAQTDLGKNIPSPSPSVMWDGSLNGDNHNVCKSALVSVEFTALLNQPSVNANTVVVYECSSVSGNDCTKVGGVVPMDNTSYNLRIAQGGNNQDHHYLQLTPTNEWKNNTWYQVVLKNQITSQGVNTALFADKPCNEQDSAYCFVFRTDQRACKLNAVLVTPTNYTTRVLESPMQYHTNSGATPVVYNSVGISDQHCVVMDTRGFNWDWDTDNHTYATIYNKVPDSTEQKVSALGNTVGVVSPDNSVEVQAVASTNTPQGIKTVAGGSPLTIDLSNPEVVKYWPSCLQACTNASVGVQFNVTMSNRNLLVGNPTSVRMYKCTDENCLATTPVVNQLSIGFDQASQNTILNIAGAGNVPTLATDTLYKVVVSFTTNDLSSPDLLWSAALANDLNSFSKPMNKEFTWRFRTKANSCAIDRVDVTPHAYNAQMFDDRAVYKAQPYSSPDQCSAEGQPLNAWNVAWNWTSSDTQVATVQKFTTLGANPYCTNRCIKKGSSIASFNKQIPVCGNGVVEAGEDCDSPSKANGCALDCKFSGNANPVTCGNGVVEPLLGEACDPQNAATKIGCSSQCLHVGSSQALNPNNPNASICGNGQIGSGEDCDIGITGDITKPLSGLYCTASCLHTGTTLSIKWCSDHAQDLGGFTAKEYQAACSKAVSMCGDGVTSPDEDGGCDLGGGKHADFCSDYCRFNKDTNQSRQCAPNSEGCSATGQYSGSSLSYSTASVCGNGATELGEDSFCESNLVSTHANIIDPWALVSGVGRGTPSGNPPVQSAVITGETNQQTKGGTVSGSGTFTLMCGYKTDADCQAATNNLNYGVGADTCCYPRPKLTATYPATTNPIQKDVCRNTSIEADFTGLIDPATLKDNILLAVGTNQNAPGVQKQLVHAAHVNAPMAGIPAVNAVNVAMQGDKVYVLSATNGGEFQIYTVNGNSLTFVSKLTAAQVPYLANAFDLVVSGRYAYTVQYNGGGIQIIDVNDPLHPVAAGNIQDATLTSAATVAIDGDTLYATSWGSGKLFIIDVSNHASPRIASTIVNGQNGAFMTSAMSVTAENGYAYVGGWGGNFQIINATNPAAPVVLGHLVNGQNVNGKVAITGTARALIKKGNYVYLASYNNNVIQVIDVQDPNAPKPVTNISNSAAIPLSNPVDFAISGNYLFVVSQSSPFGLAMLDITNPAAPVAVAAITTASDSSGLAPFNTPNGLTVGGGVLYIASNAVSGGVDTVDFHTFLAADSTCTADVSSMIALAPTTWYGKIWQSVIAFVSRLFGSSVTAKQTFVPSDWCTTELVGVPEVVYDSTTTSRVVYHMNKPLGPDTTYAIILREGIKDMHGVSIGKPQVGNYNWQFNTGANLCEIARVQLVPNTVAFNTPNTTTTIEAKAFTAYGSQIQPMRTVYDWEYHWGPFNDSVVTLSQTTSSRAVVGSQNRNGEVDVYASAYMVSNQISASDESVATGKSHAIVYLCENPWPTKQATIQVNGVNVVTSTFPYADAAWSHSGYSALTKQFDGSTIPASNLDPTIVGDGYFNFSTYYCADSGVHGTADDLPYVHPAVQAQNNVVSPSGVLKRFIFTNDSNSDGIGIQVFSNPNHLSPREWYSNDKSRGGNGFVGALRDLTVDGYKAVRDDNNVYIDAVNYATAQQTLYSNIYLIGINADASAGTRAVFDQMLKNLHFNINLTNYGYCGKTIDNPDFMVACKTDMDCTNGSVCAVQIDKLKRNYTRYNDARAIDVLLTSYARAHQNSMPDLKEGTYLSGQDVSTWPTWSLLGNVVGSALPVDPINQLGAAGTCKNNPKQFCVTNSQCGNDTCVLHDPVTGWSTVDRRFSFACATSSYAYRYEYKAPSSYSFTTHLENFGATVRNTASFLSGFGYSTATFVWGDDTVGICRQAGEISTLSAGVCGDGQINANLGEKCDPPGTKVYNTNACAGDPVNGQVTVQTCNNTCTYDAPTTLRCSDFLLAKCGNGKLDPGETCDDGAQNGKYNHCTKQCTWPPVNPPGYCGDSITQAGSELCDKGGSIFYALKKTDSCNFDCQSYGPYCGDGIVSPQAGEDCDTAQADLSCSVNGTAGKYTCNNRCKFGEDALLWLPFDEAIVNNGVTTYADQTDNNNNATCSGHDCPEFLPPGSQDATDEWMLKGGMRFTLNRLVVADKPSLNTTSSISVRVLLDMRDQKNWVRIVEKGGWGVGGGFSLQQWGGSKTIEFAVFGQNKYDYYAAVSKDTLGEDSVQDIVAVFTRQGNNQTIKIYVNGDDNTGQTYLHINDPLNQNPPEPMNTQSYTGPIQFLASSAGKDLIIGSDGGNTRNYDLEGGYIDDLHIYNRALTPNQVKALHTQLVNRTDKLCQIPAEFQISQGGSCGDGKVDANEACDNGAANGQVCAPGYNRSCTYCAGDCRNVITVSPVQYCGNGTIEAAEMCEFDAGGVYAKVQDAKTTEANPATNAKGQPVNGYKVLSCESEVTPAEIFKKGTKICSNNCGSISIQETGAASCIACGIDVKSGVRVGGNLLNVLEQDQIDAIYGNPNLGTKGGTIGLYASTKAVGYVPSPIMSIQGDVSVVPRDSSPASSYVLQFYPNFSQPPAGEAKIGSNNMCSDTSGAHYVMAINYDTPRAFDFKVKANPDPWDYDLLLSPIISAGPLLKYQPGGDVQLNNGTPDNIRVVVRWVKNADFNVGISYEFLNGQGAYVVRTVEDGALAPNTRFGAASYFNQPYSDVSWQGLWYHGFNNTPGQLDAEAFTIDTSKLGSNWWRFYVRTSNLANGIKAFGSSAKLRVDVYLPETNGSMYYNLFSRPSKSFVLDLAQISNNVNAPYWHVMDVVGPYTEPQIANRIKAVQKDDPLNNNNLITYPNGQIITSLSDL